MEIDTPQRRQVEDGSPEDLPEGHDHNQIDAKWIQDTQAALRVDILMHDRQAQGFGFHLGGHGDKRRTPPARFVGRRDNRHHLGDGCQGLQRWYSNGIIAQKKRAHRSTFLVDSEFANLTQITRGWSRVLCQPLISAR